jgi:DNA repair exonuclease SbcCD ATPase subunit
MWIRRLAVAHWRGLTFELDGLAPGLNLIAGPNESGKSRLVEALRFAFFESSSGQAAHKKNLASWGMSPEKPRVSVTFNLGGVDWQLDKVFLDRGCNTRLRGGTEHLDGEAAEARLGELLHVTAGSGRTEARLEDQGMWSLLWVEQGTSRDLPAHNPESQNRLLDALGREIGEATAGVLGERILARAAEQASRYYTEKTWSERPVLKEARDRLAACEADLEAAVAAHRSIIDAADALQRARAEAAELEERYRAAVAEQRETAARQRAAEQLKHALDMAQAALAQTEGELRSAAERLTAAEAMAGEARAAADRITELEEQTGAAEAAVAAARERFEGTAAELADLQRRLDEHDTEVRRLRRREALAAQQERLTQAQQRLTVARTLADRQNQQRDAVDRLPKVTADDVERLRAATSRRAAALAQLEGASVSIEVTAKTDIRVDDESLSAGSSTRLLVTDERRIELGDTASIRISPGAGELVRLRDAARAAEQEARDLCETLNVDDADAAERAVRRRAELEAELERLARDLAERVPEGIDQLDRDAQTLQAQVDAAAADAAPDEGFNPRALAAAEDELRSLAEQLSEARSRREAEQERLVGLREALARCQGELDAARRSQHELQARLADQPDVTTLSESQQAAESALAQRLAARDDARRRFAESGGERLADDVDRTAKAEAALAARLRETRDTCLRLETVLGQAHPDARHERVQALEADVAAARGVLARLERDSQAARRLYEVLEHEYRAARERLTQPVIDRIRPYLADLFPGSQVWLDESLNLMGLRGPDAREPFEFLSGGAREQLALLVRIGLAEVLGTEESWPLVLDDVLVNTDPERIRRIQRALYHAGQRMQILLFTCHGALFDALGPDVLVALPAPDPRK